MKLELKKRDGEFSSHEFTDEMAAIRHLRPALRKALELIAELADVEV